jgi:hypothetical protein
VALAVGYLPVPLDGEFVPLPVGITDPHYFRVVENRVVGNRVGKGQPARPVLRPQLAATGGMDLTAPLAWAAAGSVGGGAALLGCARRRRATAG